MLCLKLKKAFSALSRPDTINKKAAKVEEVRAARLEAIERKVAQGEQGRQPQSPVPLQVTRRRLNDFKDFNFNTFSK